MIVSTIKIGGNMKKLIIALLVVLSATLGACSSDSENNSSGGITAEENIEISGDLKADQNSNIGEFIIEKGTDLSNLTFKTIEGKEVKIDNFNKNVVFLNFFTTT